MILNQLLQDFSQSEESQEESEGRAYKQYICFGPSFTIRLQ